MVQITHHFPVQLLSFQHFYQLSHLLDFLLAYKWRIICKYYRKILQTILMIVTLIC
ncbi:unnamed protein product [Schistosoma mattheei]|uniref:Uncharacterized protein n=1 Tax=Schistosoma mattheei TaxID=31246 RepID=A0A183NJ35_9TREM|nr:unnamed protein product [Schistosoma mattheei]